jgi:hypothetical protein
MNILVPSTLIFNVESVKWIHLLLLWLLCPCVVFMIVCLLYDFMLYDSIFYDITLSVSFGGSWRLLAALGSSVSSQCCHLESAALLQDGRLAPYA